MEVHAHTHTARKKWTHYFWEFFMLFLAVFCGFFAENQREHYIEHQREKKYMKALLADLRSDSASLTNYAYKIEKLSKGLDTLIYALRKPLSKKANLDYVYILYMKYGNTGVRATFSENTISQLKNAGALRIIRKEDVIEKINLYEKQKYIVLRQSDDIWKLLCDIENNRANLLLDFTGNSPILNLLEVGDFNSNTDSLMQLASGYPLPLINNDKHQIAFFRNAVRSIKSMFFYYLSLINQSIAINSELATIVKKEYKLK